MLHCFPPEFSLTYLVVLETFIFSVDLKLHVWTTFGCTASACSLKTEPPAGHSLSKGWLDSFSMHFPTYLSYRIVCSQLYLQHGCGYSSLKGCHVALKSAKKKNWVWSESSFLISWVCHLITEDGCSQADSLWAWTNAVEAWLVDLSGAPSFNKALIKSLITTGELRQVVKYKYLALNTHEKKHGKAHDMNERLLSPNHQRMKWRKTKKKTHYQELSRWQQLAVTHIA